MGLATIDPHSQKEHAKIHKIPEFGVKGGETYLQQLYKSVAKEISKPPFFGS